LPSLADFVIQALHQRGQKQLLDLVQMSNLATGGRFAGDEGGVIRVCGFGVSLEGELRDFQLNLICLQNTIQL
jgi:hypothetical protein